MIEKFLTAREVADLTGLQVGTLAAWRCRSRKKPDAEPRGPEYRRLGRAIRYPEGAVQRWLAQQAVAAVPRR